MKEKQIIKKAVDVLYSSRPNEVRFAYSKNGFPGLCFKGQIIYIFNDSKKFPLSFDKDKALNMDKLINSELDYRPATATIQKHIKGPGVGKELLVTKIENTYGYAFVQTELLKNFINPTFEIAERKSLVKVYEGHWLVGIICPVNHIEE